MIQKEFSFANMRKENSELAEKGTFSPRRKHFLKMKINGYTDVDEVLEDYRTAFS